MNPFEDFLDNNTNLNLESKPNFINIWIEIFGRKKKTYISGWNISDEQLKEHLKTIKTQRGCNGTIGTIKEKENPHEVIHLKCDKSISSSTLQLIKVIELQGDHSKYIKDFLIKNKVDPNNIYIKG
jgi:translation initiation factor 1 (eIF-1/SUI1)